MIHMTLDYITPTQSSVIRIIHHNVGLKCFFKFYQNVCLLLSLCIHMCGEKYNNHIIANCSQSVSVKKL